MLSFWQAKAERRSCFNEIGIELMEKDGKGYVVDNLDI